LRQAGVYDFQGDSVAALADFTRTAVSDWAKANLMPKCDVYSDGLDCFSGVIDAGCAHTYS